MTLLVFLSSLITLSFSYSSVTYPALDSRFRVVIGTCVENVTIASGDAEAYGSSICYCTATSVNCYGYSSSDCTGEIEGSLSWGGCDQTTFPREFARIDGCYEAMEAASSGTCGYFVEEGINSDTYSTSIRSLNTCYDYGCSNIIAHNNNSRSCKWEYDTNEMNVTYTTYDDYICDDISAKMNEWGHASVVGGNTVDCSVNVSIYTISDTSYHCGSSKSPLKPSVKSSPSKNYMLQSIGSYPIAVGQCLTQRNGFHEYSMGYVCGEDDTHVRELLYLDSKSCSGSKGFNVQNFSNTEYHIVCDQDKGTGSWNTYPEGCGSGNPDADYVESALLYNQCIPYVRDPDSYDESGDGSLFQNQPWLKDLRIVYSCAKVGGNQYPVHYFYLRPDCTGEYLFNFDGDEYYSSYVSSKGEACAYSEKPTFSNCANSGSVKIENADAYQIYS